MTKYPLFFLCTALCWTSCIAFAPSSSSNRIQQQSLYFFKFPNVLESILPSGVPVVDETASKRESLKQALLQECQSGSTTRETVEALMEELKQVNPTPATASSPLLQKKWTLEWTTEKEINFFLDWKISNEIGQTINGNNLDNNIEFVRGGGFYVSGKLNIPDAQGVRTNFEFETAKLDLGKWGQFEFPPVGAGWFDTIYLDETLRVDVNSRDDILICTPSK
jgi:PAP_fibrillin